MNTPLELLKKGNLKGLFIEPTTNSLLQFLRYVFVGGVATIADWSTVFMMTEALDISPYVSAIFGFFAGLIFNYFLSKLLVFKENHARVSHLGEFVAYGIIGIIGLAITEGIMVLTTNTFGWHYMVGKVISTLVVLVWNYLARKKLIYTS